MNSYLQINRPVGDVPDAYLPYVSRAGDRSLADALHAIMDIETFIPAALLRALRQEVYAKGKWTVLQILQHIIDTERIFQYRVLRIARGDKAPLESFDENEFARNCHSGVRSVASLLEEYRVVHQSTIFLFESLDEKALRAMGTVSGKAVSVATIGYIISGHMMHHMEVIRQKYIPLLKEQDLVMIENFKPEWAPYFEQFNKHWIEKYFVLEPLDLYVLENPEEAILKKGGDIYFALFEGQVIGAVALLPLEEKVLELAKMAVDERYRGLGAGKLLCSHAIARAGEKGARKLVLYTQNSLRTALEIYRKMGFREVPLEPGVYERANVKMEMVL